VSVPPPSLIALTPGDLDDAHAASLVRLIEPCVRAGLKGVILREPLLSDRATLALARELRALLAGGWLSVHDRVHLARACGADAVQLGFRSLSPADARAVLGEGIAIGFSAHAHDEPGSWRDCDHLLFGPVFDTPSKRGVQEPVGLEGLALAKQRTNLPMWALGGLQPDHAARVIAAGAAGMAVLGGIVRAPRPAIACTQYLEALRAAGRA
jgi:thiamine-phosphate diphosphorylase